MKKIFLLFLFSNIFVVSAQWVHQNSGTTDILFDVFFPTKDTGYATTVNANLFRTFNGGVNWNNVPAAVPISLLFFISKDTGFSVNNTEIYRTYNAGSTWTTQYSNPNLDQLGAVYFADKLTGYTTGLSMNQDTIYFIKTINGGNTWNIVSWITDSVTGFLLPFRSVSFVSRDTGFFVGFDFRIYRTLNGCATVTSVFSSVAVLHAIHFPTQDTGYTVGYPDAVVKSVNMGATWNILPSSGNNEFYMDVFFTTRDTGFIAASGGALSYGKILKTTNGGNSWVTQITDTSINALHFPTRTIGYAVGTNGIILKHTGVIGIDEYENNTSFIIYPNPTSGIFTVQSINQPFNNSTITIFNSFGELIIKSGIRNQESEIDLTTHPAGIYFLKVTEEDRMMIRKIIKM